LTFILKVFSNTALPGQTLSRSEMGHCIKLLFSVEKMYCLYDKVGFRFPALD